MFATVKTAPAYPGVFPTVEAAVVVYFTEFFRWYNEEHLHSRLGMVTPQQKHDGTWVQILAEREEVKRRTLANRSTLNLGFPTRNPESPEESDVLRAWEAPGEKIVRSPRKVSQLE